MKVWHNTSSEHRKCIICQKKTGTSKVYCQSDMDVSIPVCDDHYDRVDVNKQCTRFLTDIKQQIISQA